jgi:dodecin
LTEQYADRWFTEKIRYGPQKASAPFDTRVGAWRGLTKAYLQISNNWHAGDHMAVKILELVGSSDKSWEDAVQEALREATKTVRNIVGVDVLGFKADVKSSKVTRYKAHVKIAFTVER